MPRETNMTRMLGIIDEVFATRKDPDQLQVTPAQQKKLAALHPSTLSELADEDGPIVWVLIIPTTETLMKEFLRGAISENELLSKTKPGNKFDAIYLCSATTLPEHRGKGKTKKLCVDAIRSIAADHPIKSLFVWPFTAEGDRLARAVADETGLVLYKKGDKI